LLSILDQSPYTHCRNEPNRLDGSPLTALLPLAFDETDNCVELEAKWDESVRWASRRMGERDHRIPTRKQHVREWSRRMGLYRAVDSPRIRRTLSVAVPSLRGAEWVVPQWIGSPGALEESLPVLKLGAVPGWAGWVLDERPEALVVHIVRHPGGFLNSWRTRFLNKHDRTEVTLANRERLRAIATREPDWAALFGDFEQMSAEESELWFWRYCCEVTDGKGAGSSRYLLVIYEQLTQRTLEISRTLYEACGLEWTKSIARRIERTSASSQAIASTWRTKLNRDEMELVERVLDGSALSTWWS
jgi:hypothetical protein